MDKPWDGLATVIGLLVGLIVGLGISGLTFWGIGAFVVWAFNINFVWTFWHGLAVAIIGTVLTSMLASAFARGNKE